MLETLLQKDTEALVWASSLIPAEYAMWVQIFAEGIVIWVAVFLVLLWLSGTFTKKDDPKIASLSIAVLIFTVFGVYLLINLWLPQWRESPQDVVGGMQALIPRPADNSFPSGHGLFTGAFLVGLWYYCKKPWFIVLSLVVGITSIVLRVMGGVHYFGDIIAGILLGTIAGVLLRPVAAHITNIIAPLALKVASWLRL